MQWLGRSAARITQYVEGKQALVGRGEKSEQTGGKSEALFHFGGTVPQVKKASLSHG